MRHLAAAVTVILGLGCTHPAWADDRIAKARELLSVSGTETLMVQMMDQSLLAMMPLLRQSLKDAPPGFFALAEEEMTRGFRNASGDFISLGIAEYAQSFSEDELDQLLVFYHSPTGRKVIAKQPELMQRLVQQSQVLGQRIGEDSMKRAIKRFEAGERKP